MSIFSKLKNSGNSSNEINDKSNPSDTEKVKNKKVMTQEYLYWKLTESEAIDLCKQQVDTMERWSRRLIDETFYETYGENYFTEAISKQHLFKKELIDKINGRMKNDQAQFPRPIDAIVIEDLIYIFCKDDFYVDYFKDVFEPYYSGKEEVRRILKCISDIRNKYSHGRTLSQHEIEQCICYANDMIEVFKSFYRRKGKDREYNVPVFISFKDSLGNNVIRENPYNGQWSTSASRLKWEGKLTSGEDIRLRSGERYRLKLEVDGSFPPDFYEITWEVSYGYYKDEVLNRGKGNIIEFSVDDKSVSRTPTIKAMLKTERNWHRFGKDDCDDIFEFTLRPVLPPIEDTY